MMPAFSEPLNGLSILAVPDYPKYNFFTASNWIRIVNFNPKTILMKRKKKELPEFEKVKITDAGSEGKAVGRVGDMVVFVPFVVPGDIVDIKATKKRRSYYEGRAVRFHHLSEKRAEPACRHFGVCGGCRWQNMSYLNQLQYKQKQVSDNFQRIGKLEYKEIQPIIPSANEYFYRNKLEYTFSNRRWLIDKEELANGSVDLNGLGFHLPGMFDRVLDIEHCHLQEENSNTIRLKIRQFALDHDFSFYDRRRNTGFLRNLVIRNTTTGQWMVVVVFGEENEKSMGKMMEFVRDELPFVSSLHYIINQKVNDDTSDLEVVHFAGDPYIVEELAPWREGGSRLKFKISPASFFQTNTIQAERLYRVAADLAGFRGNELVYDLYTGAGTIANYIAGHVKEVIGIEYVEAAVNDAVKNSALNHVNNARFYHGDIAGILDPAFMKENGMPDLIITDPPRAGMHEKVIERIIQAGAEKVVYISCNPATQARDIALMHEHYSIGHVQPVDMFPQTQHVENVVLLRKRTTKG